MHLDGKVVTIGQSESHGAVVVAVKEDVQDAQRVVLWYFRHKEARLKVSDHFLCRRLNTPEGTSANSFPTAPRWKDSRLFYADDVPGISTVTSRCNRSGTLCSPSCLIGLARGAVRRGFLLTRVRGSIMRSCLDGLAPSRVDAHLLSGIRLQFNLHRFSTNRRLGNAPVGRSRPTAARLFRTGALTISAEDFPTDIRVTNAWVLIRLSFHRDGALEIADGRPRVVGALEAYKGGGHRGIIVR